MIEIGDGRVLTCQQVCTDILLKALGGKLNTQVGLSGSRWANTANNESKPMVKETKTDIVQSKEGMKKKKDMVASNIVEDLGKAIEVFDATAYGRGK